MILDTVNPEVKFVVFSTGASGAGEAVSWELAVKYRAVGEAFGGASNETLLQLKLMDTLAGNTRQSDLVFTLDRTLISDQDIILLVLTRKATDAADTYGSDIAIDSAIIELESELK